MIAIMKTKLLNSVLASLVLWAGSVLPALAESAPKGPELVVSQFVEAWNAHDMRALGDLLTTDVDWVTASGKRLGGREKVRAYLAEEHSTWARTTRMEAADVYVRHLNRGTAMVFFEWQIAPAKGEAAAPPRRGNNLFIARQFGSGWILAAGQVARAD